MRPLIGLLTLAAVITASAVDAQTAPGRWNGRVDLTIGGPDETREPYMFDIVGGLELDRSGRIIVAQPKTSSIRVFSPSGAHLFSFGRAGAGPGDLAFPCCIATDAGGRLWVKEIGNRRYSLFRLDSAGATHLSSVRAPGGSGGSMDRLRWDARGALLHVTTESFDASPLKTIRHHADSTGAVTKRDTLRDAPVDSASRVSITRKISGGVSTYWIEIPFAPRFLRAEGPGGQLVEANSARYEVLWLDPGLQVVRTLRAKAEPVELTAAEVRATRDSITEFAARQSARVELGSVEFPARKPALVSLGFDLDGRLWVERSVAQGQEHEADVYDPQGRLIARATWPRDVSIKYHAIRGMTGLGIRNDPDTDVPSIVRLSFSRR